MFSEKQIKNLQQIHKDASGREISKEEAVKYGAELADIHKRIIKINIKVLEEKNGNFQKN